MDLINNKPASDSATEYPVMVFLTREKIMFMNKLC